MKTRIIYNVWSVVLAGLLVGLMAGRAATIQWANPVSGNWNIATNWSPAQVPGPTDEVFITVDGAYTVTVNATLSLSNLTVGGASGTQAVALTGGYTLTVSNAANFNANAVWQQSAGTLACPGQITLAGSNQWAGGTLNANLAIAPGGVLLVSSAAAHSLTGRTLRNQGVVLWRGGPIYVNGGTVFDNQGSLRISSTNNIDTTSGTGTFLNTGTVLVESGVSAISVNTNVSLGGRYQVAAGAGLNFAAPTLTTFERCLFEGAGTNRVTTTAYFNGTNTSENLEFVSGYFRGTNVLEGALRWVGGLFDGAGTTLIPAGTTLTITGSGAHTMQVRHLRVEGAVDWRQGPWYLNNSAVLINAGTILASATNSLDTTAGYGGFINQSLFSVLAGNHTVSMNTNASLGAEYRVAAGCLLNLSSPTLTTFESVLFNGEGTNRLNTTAYFNGTNTSVNLELANGYFRGTNVFAGTTRWVGGLFDGGGTTLLPAGATLVITGTGQHTAQTRVLEIEGDVLWQQGPVYLNIGARVIHRGRWLVSSGSNLSTTSGYGAFENWGEVEVLSGNTIMSTSTNRTWGGLYRVQPGAQLTLSSGNQFLQGASFLGAGRCLVDNSTLFDGTQYSECLELTAGTFTGTNVFTGTVIWSGGTLSGAGVTLFDAGSTLVVSGGNHILTTKTLATAGVVTWQGGSILYSSGALVENTGTWEVTTDADHIFYSGAASTFHNLGTYRCASPGTHAVGGSVLLNNDGLVEVLSGSMVQNSAGTSAGTFLAHAGTSLELAQSHVMSSSSSVSGEGLVRFSAGTLTVSGQLAGQDMELGGATLTGSPTVTGTLRWTSGYLGASGQTLVASQGTLVIESADNHFLSGHLLRNQGTLRWTGGNLFFTSASTLANESLWSIECNNHCYYYSGTASVVSNSGTLRKSGAAGTNSIGSSVAFSNSGTVELLAGGLSLQNIGGPSTGHFLVASNACLIFANSHTLALGCSFAGEGRIQFAAGSTSIHGEFDAPGFELVGGELWGTNTFQGGFLWAEGTLGRVASPSATTVGVSGRLTIATASLHFLNNTRLTVLGEVVQNASTLHTQTGPVIHNLGQWTSQGTSHLYYNNGDVAAFLNEGTIRKQDTNRFTLGSNVLFTNSGQVILENGEWYASTPYVQTAGATRLEGGFLTVTTPAQILGGVLAGVGNVNASVLNSGALQPGNPLGVLTINGALTQSAAGSIDLDLAGVDPGVTFDQVVITGTAGLNGTLNVQLLDEFTPPPGAGYMVLTYNAKSNAFAAFNYPSNVTMQLTNTPTATYLNADNTAPYIFPISNKQTPELTNFTCAIRATNYDDPPQAIIFSLTSKPAGMTIHSNTGVISWTPTEQQGPSTNVVTVRATDDSPAQLYSQRSFNVVVTEVPDAPVIISQPGDHIVWAGGTATFSVYATGTSPLFYQWRFRGTNLAGATASSLILTNCQTNLAGLYSVVIRNSIGATNSRNALLTVWETNKPTVTLTAPSINNQRISALPFTLAGTAKDNVQVSHVYYSLNSGSWHAATLSSNGANVSWSATLYPRACSNSVTVYARDWLGNTSGFLTRSFWQVSTNQLDLTVVGSGLVVAKPSALGTPTNGAWLEIGQPYTVTATPGQDWVFTNWSGATNTLTNVITFVMQSNLTLQAKFIPNPFLPIIGDYRGLFYATNGVALESAGHFTMKLRSNLTFSASLQLDGDNIPFSGRFRVDGTWSNRLYRVKFGKPDLTVLLAVDLTRVTQQTAGSVSSDGWTSVLVSDRDYFNKTNLATTYQGAYTMAFPGFEDPAVGPPGYGYGAITVKTNGAVSWSGETSDGRTVRQASALSRHGTWPLYVPLYLERDIVPLTNARTQVVTLKTNRNYKGALLGWVTLTNVATTNLAPVAGLSWIKRFWTNGLYDVGFTNEGAILGSSYRAPAKGVTILSFTNATVVLTHGNLESNLVRTVDISTNNLVKITPTNQAVKLSFMKSSGLCNGTFHDPGRTNASTKLRGVVLQEQDLAAGWFLGTNQGGLFRLQGP